jgi:biotin carboxylase
VAICAKEDLQSPHVADADEYVVVRGEGAIGPYLNVEGLTEVCLERGVDLVHPGEFAISYDVHLQMCIPIVN